MEIKMKAFKLSSHILCLFSALLLCIGAAHAGGEAAICNFKTTGKIENLGDLSKFLKIMLPRNCNFVNEVCTITWNLDTSKKDWPFETNFNVPNSQIPDNLDNFAWQDSRSLVYI